MEAKMPTKDELVTKFSHYTDSDLSSILAQSADWSVEAIEAAKEILSNRDAKLSSYEITDMQETAPNSISVYRQKWIIDWADVAVPLTAGILHAISRHRLEPFFMVGYSLGVFLLFGGTRQIVWTINQKKAKPTPREPGLAFVIGVTIWIILIFYTKI